MAFSTMDAPRANSKSDRIRLPKECPQCAFLKPPPMRECPACGFKAEATSDIEVADGELIEVSGPRKRGGEACRPDLDEPVLGGVIVRALLEHDAIGHNWPLGDLSPTPAIHLLSILPECPRSASGT